MRYMVRFLYGEQKGGLVQWSGPVSAANPEEAVKKTQDVVWDDIKVFRLAEADGGGPEVHTSEDLDVEPPDYPEPGDLW